MKSQKMNWDRLFLSEVKKAFKKGKTLDMGGGTLYQREIKQQTTNKQKAYINLDFSVIVRPDIVGDAHRLPIRDQSVDTVILTSVLEHVYNPFQVIGEARRVLKKRGKVILWVPFIYPYHAAETYEDYYRFTDTGVKEVLKEFTQVKVIPTRGYFETLINLLPKPFSGGLAPIGGFLDGLLPIRKQHSGFGALAIK